MTKSNSSLIFEEMCTLTILMFRLRRRFAAIAYELYQRAKVAKFNKV